jgi:hypothetical protein
VIEMPLFQANAIKENVVPPSAGLSKPARAAIAISLAVVATMLAFSSAARAEFGVVPNSFEATVSSLQAGAHPDATTTFAFKTKSVGGIETTDGSAKDIVVDLPPGLIGNPQAVAQCNISQLTFDGILFHGGCPRDTMIGIAHLDLLNGGEVSHSTVGVFNVEPIPGEPAAFAFNAGAFVTVRLDASIATESDYHVRIHIGQISQILGLKLSSLTLWGVPAQHNGEGSQPLTTAPGSYGGTGGGPPLPFLTNATECGNPAGATLSVQSWENPGITQTVAAPLQTLSGCEKLRFTPSLSLIPGNRQAGQPAAYSVDLAIPQTDDPEALGTPPLRNAEVVLPQGVTISPAAADGLEACSDAQAMVKSASPATCPEGSKLATVQIETPLLAEPLQGAVFLGTQQSGDPRSGQMYRLFLQAQGSGVTVKLPGEIRADPATGQLTATFDNNPQLPFSDLALNFKGGDRAPLTNPTSCGTYTTRAFLTPYAAPGAAPVESDSSFTIDQDCDRMGRFEPSLNAGLVNAQAGGSSPFTLTLTRPDGQQDISGLTVALPPGVLGNVGSVPLCPDALAAAGTCGTASQIGQVTAFAGAGASPVSIPQVGKPPTAVYLAGPYKGAPYSLSIVVPAQAGPFNLGTIVVRAALFVDRNDAHVTVKSDPLPTILDGVPLHLSTINVTIDRPGFMRNATNCSSFAINGTAQSAQGASAAVTSRFQAANCANLPFKPGFSVATQGATSKANGASLSVKVTSGAGQANIGKVLVSLPKQLPSRLTTLQKACVAAVFEASPAQCPAAAVVGSATAVTPILAHPLTGPAYLVSHGGEAFPDLVIVLQGEGIRLDLDGKTNIKNGITSNTFNTVPDAPISSFALSLPEGPHSVLATNLPAKANRSMCGQSLTMPTTLTGQNGAVVKQTTKLSVSGCPKPKPKAKHKSVAKRRKSGSRKR